MWRAAFEILAAIAKPLSKLWMRKQDQADEPGSKNQKQKDENREAIADGNAGELLDRRLNRLPTHKDS